MDNELSEKKEREYGDYYVAFIDLLGFKNIVFGKKRTEIEGIFDTLETCEMRNAIHFTEEDLNVPLEDVKRYIMSDSIVLYIESKKKNSLRALLEQCEYLGRTLLSRNEPILLRGGVAKGEFARFQSRAFGPALTNAYLIQEKSANTPRIILLGQLIKEGAKNDIDESDELKNMVYIDKDGFYCVNYFKYLTDKACANVDEVVTKVLNTETDVRIREKYIYLREKISDSAAKVAMK